jgi:hypothetical protein
MLPTLPVSFFSGFAGSFGLAVGLLEELIAKLPYSNSVVR